jgi:branched-chain amino acid aminotransferase
MQPTKLIWLNGKIVPWKSAQIHCMSHTLNYGTGAFEGIRIYKTTYGSAIFRLSEHITRLIQSFSVFSSDIPWTEDQISAAIIEIVKANQVTEGYIRPLLFFGPGTMHMNPKTCPINLAIAVFTLPQDTLPSTLRISVSPFQRISAKSTFIDKKIVGHYVNSVLAQCEAKSRGFDDALLLDDRNCIAECSAANFFIVSNGILKTPFPVACLPGITRQSIIKIAQQCSIKVEEINMTLNELESAQEAFATGTVTEILPISAIDNKTFTYTTESTTFKIQKAFSDGIMNGSSIFKEWLYFI